MCEALEQKLKKTFFLVEATSFEYHCLWSQFSRESKNRLYEPLTWIQDTCYSVSVGTYNKRPVNISIMFSIIDGHLIAFWNPISLFVDYKLIEEYFNKKFIKKHNGIRSMCDAMNFGNCVNAIKRS